jgi:hypothetical protein
MAQSGFTPIQLYYSTSAGNTPLAADLTNGELAINTNDGILYYKDSGGVVQVLASGSSISILAVTAATTANITLSGLQTIDGISVTASQRVLVKDQTLSENNGVYVASAGAWTRSIDSNSSTEIAGRVITVRSGTVNGGEQWATTFKSTDTLGTTAMLWYQVALQNTAVAFTDVDATNLEVTNIKAKDGTASISLADTTGIATFSNATVVSTFDNTNAALRITQLGSGNALLVEDATNPDATPFAIDSTGTVLVGNTTAQTLDGITPAYQQLGANNYSSMWLGRYSANNTANYIVLSKSRSATVGTNTIVNSGDDLGTLAFYGADGTNLISAASILGEVDGAPSVGVMPGRLVFSTTNSIGTLTERMRIDSAGNVGIGITVPGAKLDISANNSGASNNTLRFTDTDTSSAANQQTGRIEFYTSDSSPGPAGVHSFILGSTENTNGLGALSFATGQSGSAAERMRINSSGNVGIGTTSPAVKLAISSTDAILIPVGTTGERPTAATGYLRFNSTTTQFEGYNGTAWSAVGGGSEINNDTVTATNLYPLFAAATSGIPTIIYTSNAKYLYKPSTGELQASALVASNGLVVNSNTVATSYSIPSGSSAMSAGPMSVSGGVVVTVPSGSRWVVV